MASNSPGYSAKLSSSSSFTHEATTTTMGYDDSSALEIQILLSRPYYRIGGKPIVGTIFMRQSNRQSHQTSHTYMNSISLLRDRIESLQFTMIGLCRYDPRWFNTNKVHTERNHLSSQLGLPTDYELPPYTVPFWTSNIVNEPPMDLLHVNERDFGKWDDVNPMLPIQLPSTRRLQGQQKLVGMNGNSNVHSLSSNERDTKAIDENHQLAFTFRINLPAYCPNASMESNNTTTNSSQLMLPHTFHGASCRYYYVIVVRLQQKTTSLLPEIEWIQCPITILPQCHPDDISICTPNHTFTDNNEKPSSHSSSSSSSSLVQIMAHSNGLPTRLTAIELNQWEGRYMMNRLGSSLYKNMSRGQSIPIVDPTTKGLVGILTILGTPNNLHHGSRLTLKMDFPIRQPPTNEDVNATVMTFNKTTKIIPCYQVSACLQGQEITISSSKTNHTRKRTTARRYVWDTAQERIDPDTTECVALDLLVPETVPCNIQTPNVELNIQCIIDIAIGTSARGSIDYRNIHLEVPCHVRPCLHDWERTNDDSGDDVSSSQHLQGTVRQLYDTAKQLRSMPSTMNNGSLENGKHLGDKNGTIDFFDTSDIQTDLKLLSVQMAKICHLKPKTDQLEMSVI